MYKADTERLGMTALSARAALGLHLLVVRVSRTVLGLLSDLPAGFVTSWLQIGQTCTKQGSDTE